MGLWSTRGRKQFASEPTEFSDAGNKQWTKFLKRRRWGAEEKEPRRGRAGARGEFKAGEDVTVFDSRVDISGAVRFLGRYIWGWRLGDFISARLASDDDYVCKADTLSRSLSGVLLHGL